MTNNKEKYDSWKQKNESNCLINYEMYNACCVCCDFKTQKFWQIFYISIIIKAEEKLKNERDCLVVISASFVNLDLGLTLNLQNFDFYPNAKYFVDVLKDPFHKFYCRYGVAREYKLHK